MSINTKGLSIQQIKIIEDLVTELKTNAINEPTSPISTPIDHPDLVESAELYAEIYREDQELQALTEAALIE